MVKSVKTLLNKALSTWGKNQAMYSSPGAVGSSYKLQRVLGLNWHPTRARKNSPGRKRKLGPNAYMKPARRNILKRAFKSCVSSMPRLQQHRHSFPAPTQDQVRTLERRYNVKLIVKMGQLCYRNTGLPIDYTSASYPKLESL